MNTNTTFDNSEAIENALALMNMSIFQTCRYCRFVYDNALVFMNAHRYSNEHNLQIDVQLRVANDNATHLSRVSIRNYIHVLYEVNDTQYRSS